jgi:conjugative transposon TraN protein
MKIFFLSVVLLLSKTMFGQTDSIEPKVDSTVTSIKFIFVSAQETSSLLFKQPIVHVDRGSADILAQIIPSQAQILMIKAARPGFPPTNLTVITRDGHCFTLRIGYSDHPDSLQYTIGTEQQIDIQAIAAQLTERPATTRRLHTRSFDITLRIRGLYMVDQRICFVLEASNGGPIDYHPAYLRWRIVRHQKGHRSAQQEHLLNPLYQQNELTNLAALSTTRMAILFDSFTLPKGERLLLELAEHNGGRALRIRVRNKDLLKALPIGVSAAH